MRYSHDEIAEIATRYQTLKCKKKLKGVERIAYNIKKLCEEVGELAEACMNGNIAREELLLEIGDVQIILMVIANAFGVRADECAEKKIGALLKRIERLKKERG